MSRAFEKFMKGALEQQHVTSHAKSNESLIQIWLENCLNGAKYNNSFVKSKFLAIQTCINLQL